MRKVLLFALLLIIISTTGCGSTGYYPMVPDKPTLTPTNSTTNQGIPQTPEPDIAPTVTSTPELDPYVFDTDSGYIDMSIGSTVIEMTEGPFRDKDTKVEAQVVSPKNLGGFDSTAAAFNDLGSGLGVVRPDKYGNLLFTAHSSYDCSGDVCEDPLEAEPWRVVLEEWGYAGDKYIKNKLTEIENTNGVLTVNGVSIPIKILGGVRLEHNEEEEVWHNPEQVVDIVTKKDGDDYLAMGNAGIFEGLKIEGHEILINFCGWGPETEFGRDYSYYRYVILIEVVEKSETPERIN